MHHLRIHASLYMLWFVLYVLMIENLLYDDLMDMHQDADHELNQGKSS